MTLTRAEKSDYMRLLANPFDRRFFGSKVGDPFSAYTDTYQLHTDITVFVENGQAYGGFVVKCNPFFTAIDTYKFAGATTNTIIGGLQPIANNVTYFYSMTNPTVMGGIMTNYRIVAHGLRLRLNMPQAYAAGRLIVARAPRTGPDVSYQALSFTTFAYLQCGNSPLLSTIPPSETTSTSLINVPGAFEVNFTDLLTKDIILVNKISSFSAFDFATTSTGAAVNTSYVFVDSGLAGTTSGTDGVASAMPRQDSTAGWDDFYFYYDGVPTITASVANIFSVETIFHLEGCPLETIANNITPVPTSKPLARSQNTDLSSIVAYSNSLPCEIVTDAATLAFNIGKSALKNGGRSMIGMAL